MKNTLKQQTERSGIVSFVKDIPNICSLAGLACSVCAIYFIVLGNFPAAMIGLIWAVVFDWSDGIIARQLKNRTAHQGAFGGQLDSLIDVVSFGIVPALLLLGYGKFNIWFLPGAFIVVATSVLRLSYFNVFGLVDDGTYEGMALDNNAIIIVFIFLFEVFFDQQIFAVMLYSLVMILSFFNLAPIRTPKFGGKWFYVLAGYSVITTIIYSWLLWK